MALSGENLQTSEHTTDPGALQKGADFVKAFVLGFDVQVSSVAVFTSFSVSEAVRILETSSFLRFSLFRCVGLHLPCLTMENSTV